MSDLSSRPRAGAGSAHRWVSLAPFLGAVIVVAALGGWAASGSRETYRALELPPFAPPGWLFGPVWTVLYLLIAIAGWLLWRSRGWDTALRLWTAQLVLNLAWTPLFFAAGLYGWALLDIVLLLIAIVALIRMAWPRQRVAAWLLVPYLLWVAYATALTIGIVSLNGLG